MSDEITIQINGEGGELGELGRLLRDFGEELIKFEYITYPSGSRMNERAQIAFEITLPGKDNDLIRSDKHE